MRSFERKLALIIPNFRWASSDSRALWHIIPYNLCLLAAVLKDTWDVQIIDAYTDNLSRQDLENILVQGRYTASGITVPMDQFAAAGHACAEIVKSALPETPVIMGGVYATVNPEQAMEDPHVDYVVIGEGERVLGPLLESIQNHGDLPEKGICFRENGMIVNRGRADLINDLDTLPLPDYSLVDYSKYSNKVERKSVDSPALLPYGRIMTSRGCPQKCVFCQVDTIAGRKFRGRSAGHVLDEIRMLKKNHGVRSLIFDDDNLFASKKRARAIFQGMIDNDLVMPWKSIATAVFHLDEPLIRLMAESGCRYICIAIESGTDRVLKEIIKKPINYEHARNMVRIAKEAGIYVSANFVIGFPTETWDEIRQTIAFAESLNTDYVKIFNAIPLKQTRLWDLCTETSSFKKDFSQDKINWNSGQIASDEFSADDLSVLRAYEWDRINFRTQERIKRTADMMSVPVEELNTSRKQTLLSVIQGIRCNANQ